MPTHPLWLRRPETGGMGVCAVKYNSDPLLKGLSSAEAQVSRIEYIRSRLPGRRVATTSKSVGVEHVRPVTVVSKSGPVSSAARTALEPCLLKIAQ